MFNKPPQQHLREKREAQTSEPLLGKPSLFLWMRKTFLLENFIYINVSVQTTSDACRVLHLDMCFLLYSILYFII